jgi:hypothetical protein
MHPAKTEEKVMDKLDLAEYYDLFNVALSERYKNTFEAGFGAIEDLYRDVRKGLPKSRALTVDDVMAIFSTSLPYVQDWTKPDAAELEERMDKYDASKLIRDLNARHDLALIKPIIYCFRELSLTALVLHHVYPEKYSMCSHHIASLLYITGRHKAGSVPEYYLEYCRELEAWGARFGLNVVKTEFALWTWYWRANHGSKEERREHGRRFDRDPWVKKRRAAKIKDSLKVMDALGFARFFLDTDPTLGAIIAWREFEVKARELLYTRGRTRTQVGNLKMSDVIPLLRKELNIECEVIWQNRNAVMHDDRVIRDEEAKMVVDGVQQFIDSNHGKFGLQ